MQQKHRHEHDTDTHEGHERRGNDLRGAVHDCRADVFALLKVPIDVFDRHRGIVNQNTDC